jgi:hypothetical protein
MECANLPFLLGDTQRRLVEVVDESDGRYLLLGLDQPRIQKTEHARLARARWKRLPANQALSPP